MTFTSPTSITLNVNTTAASLGAKTVTATNPDGQAVASGSGILTIVAAPTVTSLNRANASPSNASTVNWTLTFSSAVTGVTASNFSLSGAAATGASIGTPTTADGGLNWNVPVITGPSGGTLTLNLANAAGQSPTVSTTLPFAGASYTIDKTAPTVAVTPTGTTTNGSPITFTLTFSEAVSGLLASGITVSNGTKGTLSGSGTTYTIPVTPSGQGAVTCQVNAGAATDAAGNGNTVSNTASVTYDNVAPTVAVTPTGTTTNGSPITFTLTFSESVSGVLVSGITVTNGTKGTLSGGGTTYTIPVTPAGQGLVTCAVTGGAAQDAAGNNNSASNTASVTFDNVAPAAATITSVTDDVLPVTGNLASGGSTNDPDLTVRVTLPTTGSLALAGDTVQLYNGTGTGTALGSTYPLTAPDVSNGFANVQSGTLTNGTTYNLTARITDAAGNQSAASNTFTVIEDTTAPAAATITSVTDDVLPVTGSLTSGGFTNDPDLTVRVTLPTNGSLALAGDTIQLYNGTGTVTALGSVYPLTTTDITNGFADVQTGTLSNGTTYNLTARITDAAGNQSPVSTNTFTVTVDSVAPTVAVTPTGTTTTSSPITFTLTFSESVTGLTAGGVTVTNGTVGALSGSGTTYTIPVTPTTSGEVTCKVNAGAAQDAAGNNNAVSNTASVTKLTQQEAWRQTYFGTTTNTGNAADTADPDGDGYNNLFEYVAGLVPTDPLSRFRVRVEAVATHPEQKAIIFSPLVDGRTYVVKYKTSLTGATWTTLTNIATSDNGTERTVTDLGTTGPKFYQVEITLP